jgi:2,3-bisphosphoglycerate-dependent phosphoglycerate mutase
MERLTQIVVVRHGETEFNVRGLLQGHLDSPLTEVGAQQARALAQRLVDYKIEALYSSDLGRARKTAEAISTAINLPVIEDCRLRERAYGALEGITWQEGRDKFPQIHDGYRNEPDYVIPGGESLRELYGRVEDSMTDLAARNQGRRIAVVSHGGFISCLFRFVVGQDLAAPRRARLPNAAINVIDCADAGWLIRTWGDTAHLGPDLMSL